MTIAPLRFGAGLKGKVGDSLARGVPCVSTDIGAEGFGPVADVLHRAESASDLADLVVRSHGDHADWDERSVRGVQLIDEHFGYEAARVAVTDLCETLGVAAGSGRGRQSYRIGGN